jgi:uncharacterized protein YbjT (DUF2867 family)
MILISGGTGTMGRLVARMLLARGERVRVMSRTPERAAELAGLGAEVVTGDLLDDSSLRGACEGCDRVLAAGHSLFGRGRAASGHVDGRGQRSLLAAAKAAGVRRFIFTSMFDFGPEWRAIDFCRIKFEVEDAVRASGVPFTILRPTAFMSPHAHELMGKAIASGRRVLLFGSGDAPRNFVAPEDVARSATVALLDDSFAGLSCDIGGPEDLSSLAVVALYERLTGRPARLRRVPLSPIRAAAAVLRRVHPGISQVLRMAILTAKEGQPFHGRSIEEQFGFTPTSLEQWATERIQVERLSES